VQNELSSGGVSDITMDAYSYLGLGPVVKVTHGASETPFNLTYIDSGTTNSSSATTSTSGSTPSAEWSTRSM
jgi:hypothetical protein